MNHRDISAIVSGIAPIVREYIEKAIQPFRDRIAEFEKREVLQGEKGEAGSPGADGKDGRDGVDGKDGVPGLDGKDGEPGVAGTDGKDGEPGLAGKDGADGIDGKDGKDGEQGPPGKDGLDGKDGAPGSEGKEGSPGRDGRDGLPGVQGEKGIDGKDGSDGIDGKDGFGLDEFDVSSDDDGRTLTFSFGREGRSPIVRTIKTGIILDRGVWREEAFEKGDSLTWGGSIFIAQRGTLPTEKPGVSDAWRLSAKRGRDGASAYDVARKAGFKGSERDWVESLRSKPAPVVKV